MLQPAAGTDVRLETAPVPAAPPVPLSPRNRITRRKPVRAVLKLSRAARRAVVRAVPQRTSEIDSVLATDLSTGAEVPVTVLDRGDDGLRLRLGTAPTGPVLLGAARRQPTRSWRLTGTEPS